MDATHPIFQGPLKVEIETEEIDTPKGYTRYIEGAKLGPKMPVWKIHGKLEHKNYGLVSDGYRFADSPDAEVISGGLNTKNPGAVAIGRVGNYLLWGFVARPDEMTASARAAFLNTLVYATRFDGCRPLAAKTSRARDWASNAVRYTFWKTDEQRRQYLAGQLDPSILAKMETLEKPAFLKWLASQMRYAYRYEKELTRSRGGKSYTYKARLLTIDADARALGIANHDPALLDRCVADLAKGGEDAARAKRLLARYTDQAHADAKAWKAWLATVRGRLYFSDAYGFRFRVLTVAAAAAPTGMLAPDSVVTDVSAEVVGRTLRVRVEMAPGWYVYAPGATDADPVKVSLGADSSWEAAGPLKVVSASEEGKLYDSVVLEMPVRRRAKGSALTLRFGYQACDPEKCLPPATVALASKKKAEK